MSSSSGRPRVSRVTRDTLATQAAKRALKLRRELGLPLEEAISVFDAIDRLGIEVRFEPIPSMEGMYIRRTQEGGSPHILVSSLRPAGRQVTTAAHELGHHMFDHGTRIDQYVAKLGTIGVASRGEFASPATWPKVFDAEEFLADAFGGFFLMPKSAVDHGFAVRGLNPLTATPSEIYQVAAWLGVGYSALLQHMCWSLSAISWQRTQQLRAEPKKLRQQLLGEPLRGDVFVVNDAWSGRALDLQVGDVAIVPAGTILNPTAGRFSSAPGTLPGTITVNRRGLTIFTATQPGLGQLAGACAAFVRVARREFHGRSIFRHLELDEDEVTGDEMGTHDATLAARHRVLAPVTARNAPEDEI